MQQLRAIQQLVTENYDEIAVAIVADNHRQAGEWFLESRCILADVEHLVRNLHMWMRHEKRGSPLWMAPASSYVVAEPLGVCLNISPLNYPMTLTLNPLAAMLAAGNCAVVKMSELAPRQSALLARLIPQYLDNSAVVAVEGAEETATTLLALKWDKIMYTGSARVAKLIEQQVAGTLTPLVLELGGKSPVIVDESANLLVAARRIIHGRFINAGATCIAPDYVLVHNNVAPTLLQHMKQCLFDFYGTDPKQSADYARIYNKSHFERLKSLLESGTVFVGGDTDETELYIAPTILIDVDENAAVMQDEIFGPILPVLSVENTNVAIKFVNKRPKPLALYVFAEKSSVKNTVLEQTSSGGMAINDTVFQFLNPNLPFGGVGNSGYGSYHGKDGFDQFSHKKAVLQRSTLGDISLRYPPFTPLAQKVFSWLM